MDTCQNPVQSAELGEEALGERLNVALGNAVGQQQLEQSRIRTRRNIAVEKPPAQPLTVTGFAFVVCIHKSNTGWLKSVTRQFKLTPKPRLKFFGRNDVRRATCRGILLLPKRQDKLGLGYFAVL
jgi:hypothetical protein